MEVKLKENFIEKSCINCNELFILNKSYPRQKFCNKNCSKKYYQTNYNEKLENYRKTNSSGTVGCISELAVTQDLLMKNFCVYRSVSPNSPCDLIATKEDLLFKIEVKTGRKCGNKIYSSPVSQSKDKDYNILAIYTKEKIIYNPNLLELQIGNN